MTSASSLAFPGSRTLATWWRQLAPAAPQHLWVGYLFLHRLEAPALCLETHPLDPLLQLVLEALALELADGVNGTRPNAGGQRAGELCRRLQDRLQLELPLIRRLLESLAEMQLLERGAVHRWSMTELGQQSLTTRQVSRRLPRRLIFSFVEQFDPVGRRVAPPHFLRIHDVLGHPWQMEKESAFETAWLASCFNQPGDWKTSFGFPLEIQALASAGTASAETASAEASVTWDKVIFDRTERLLVVFVLSAEPGQLLGFIVRPEGWVLQSSAPIVSLPASARSFSGELAQDPDSAVWKQAWRAWCQARLLPAPEADACRLTYLGARLRIETPAPLYQRLLTGKSDMLKDILKGEAWLLAGEGYLRAAARLEVVKMLQ